MALNALAFAVSALVVSGCQCGSEAASDAARADASRDRGADAGRDQRVDGRSDGSQPDVFVDGACGGQRTLKPVVVPPGPATDCGAGCRRISWGASPARIYAVTGDLLVYRNVTGSPGGNRAYYVDIAANKEYRLHEDWPNLGEGCNVVATDGKRIAMSCVRAGLTDPDWAPVWLRSLTTYDPTTREATDHLCVERRLSDRSCFPDLLALNTSGITINLALHAKCAQAAPWHLPFGKATLKNLADSTSNIGHVRGAGNLVVWMEGRPEWKHYQVVAYDLDTGKRWRPDPSAADQWLPQVQGTKIVWVDHRNDPSGYRFNPRNTDIYVHDIATGKTTAVTTHPARQEEPDVWGDWVIWQDYRDAPDGLSGKELDIWAKNLATGEVYQVTDYPYLEIYPRVASGRFFYHRVVNKSTGIYMVDIAAWLKAGAKPGRSNPPRP